MRTRATVTKGGWGKITWLSHVYVHDAEEKATEKAVQDQGKIAS